MRLIPNGLLLAVFAGGVAFAAISCRDVVNPMVAVHPELRNVEGPLPHGITYAIGAGATNASPSYGGLTAFTGVTIPPGAVGRIWGSGDLTLTENPNCDGVSWGDMTSPVTPAGGIFGWGGVILSLPPDNFGIGWHGSNPNEFVWHLTNIDSISQPLMATRRGIQGECPLKDGAPGPPFDFYIAGSTTLTIDVLGVNVTASPNSVQPGEVVNFAAAPINFTPIAITWLYDTAAYQTQIEVISCAYQSTCAYVPPSSGRMQVCVNDEQSYNFCGVSPPITATAWIDGAPPCRAKVVAHYTRISLRYDSTDQYHTDPHMGQDYADSTGTPEFSADSGTVLYRGWAKSGGWAVAVRSAKPDARGLLLDSYYYHLTAGSFSVVEGQPVSAGQLLALSDDSGKWPNGKPSSHGPHVHFEQHKQTPGKGVFPNKGKNYRETGVQPCTF